MNKLDCIIVGAGFSGLTAATTLCGKGRKVRVLEARDRVGGRTESGTLAGLRIDLGGMWLGPTQKRLSLLAEQFQIRTYPTYLEGEGLIRFGPAAIRIPGEELPLAFTEGSRRDLGTVGTKIHELTEALDPEKPWLHPDAHDLDRISVLTWLGRYTDDDSIRQFITLACNSLFCAEPEQVSMLFFLFYCKSSGGFDVLLSGSEGGAQNFLFEGGVHQIATKLAGELGDDLQLNSPVTSIRQSGDGVQVTSPTGTLTAERVIVATPPGLTAGIAYEPDLPPLKRGLLRRQPMGSVIKAWIAYDRPFWRDQGLNGFVVDHKCQFTPFFDATPPGTDLGVIAGFFDANAAVRNADLSQADRKSLVIEELTSTLGSEAANPVDYQERDWTSERWSEGCYGGYMEPGTLSVYGPALRQTFGRVHWAGTETATEWSGYIEGAIQAGERAAYEVIDALRSSRR